MTMGDRICVMKLGHIMQVDTPDNLYHKPKNMFVAGFIGAPEMNIRPSQLVEQAGRLHLTVGDGLLPLNDRLQSKVDTHKNQQVFFGVLRNLSLSPMNRLLKAPAPARWCAWKTWAMNSSST
jgi:ABC-type sugar transport systems, ATPase components